MIANDELAASAVKPGTVLASQTSVQVPSAFSVALVNGAATGPPPVSIVGSAPVPQSASPDNATEASGHKPSGSVSVIESAWVSRYSPVWTVRTVVTTVP